MFLSTSDTMSWRSFMNHTRDSRSAYRGPRVWWPGLSRDLKQFIDGCRDCREHRPTQRSEPLHTSVLPDRPWQKSSFPTGQWTSGERGENRQEDPLPGVSSCRSPQLSSDTFQHGRQSSTGIDRETAENKTPCVAKQRNARALQ